MVMTPSPQFCFRKTVETDAVMVPVMSESIVSHCE